MKRKVDVVVARPTTAGEHFEDRRSIKTSWVLILKSRDLCHVYTILKYKIYKKPIFLYMLPVMYIRNGVFYIHYPDHLGQNSFHCGFGFWQTKLAGDQTGE